MLYTGIDLHRSFSYITIMNDRGEIVGQKKLPSNGEVVECLKEFDEDMGVTIERLNAPGAFSIFLLLSWLSY